MRANRTHPRRSARLTTALKAAGPTRTHPSPFRKLAFKLAHHSVSERTMSETMSNGHNCQPMTLSPKLPNVSNPRKVSREGSRRGNARRKQTAGGAGLRAESRRKLAVRGCITQANGGSGSRGALHKPTTKAAPDLRSSALATGQENRPETGKTPDFAGRYCILFMTQNLTQRRFCPHG